MKRILILILMACAPLVTHAEIIDSLTLEGVTVLGTRKVETVQSLKGEDLRNLSTTSIADALKLFAGAQIKDYGGIGGLKTINIRSLGSQHTAVFMDGVRITNAQNGTVDLGKYSTSAMESIELYNGSKMSGVQTASEYASGASIYLRTRTPSQDSLAFQYSRSSWNTNQAKILAQSLKYKTLIDLEFLSSKGNYKFKYKNQYEDTIGVRKNSDIDLFRVTLLSSVGNFKFNGYLFSSNRGCPGGIVRRLTDKYENIGREWDTDLYVQTTYTKERGDFRHQGQIRYAYEYLRYNNNYEENQNTARVDNRYHINDWYASWVINYNSRFGIINLSIDSRLSRMNSDVYKFEPVIRSDSKASISLSTDIKGVNIIAVGLFQHYKDFTATTAGASKPVTRATPTIVLTKSLKNFQFSAWYKDIFRMPTLNDLYYTQSGNRFLKPEDTKQINLGFKYTNPNWVVQVDGYYNEVTNRIVYLPMKGTYLWSALNYGKTWCVGMTSSMTYQVKSLRIQNNITLQHDWDALANAYVCYAPKISISTVVSLFYKGLIMTASHQFVGRRKWSMVDTDVLSSYNNVDVRLQLLKKKYGVCLDITDVFNIQYEHIPRYPLPGRALKLTINYNL